MSGQTFRENVAQDLAYVFDCTFSSRLVDGNPEGGVWPTWAIDLFTEVTEWAVQRFGEETPCRCGRDRFSDDGECVACP